MTQPSIVGPRPIGSTSRPEAEKAGGDGSEKSERKQLAPALGEPVGDSSPASTAHKDAGPLTGTGAKKTQPLEVVRATGRLRIELDRLADDPKEHRKRRCGGAEGGCQACLLARDLHQSRADAVKLTNICLRLLWRVDSDVLDRYLTTHGRAPKGAEWVDERNTHMHAVLRQVCPGIGKGEAMLAAQKITEIDEAKLTRNARATKKPLTQEELRKRRMERVYLYPLGKVITPELPSGMVSSLVRNAERKWKQDRFDALVRNKKRPPHFLDTMPVPIRAQDFSVQHVRKADYVVNMAIRAPEGKIRKWAVPVTAYDPYSRSLLHGLSTGEVKHGELKIERDRRRPGRWYIRVAYTRLVDPVARTAKECAVTIGICSIVSALGNDGARWIYDGRDIEAYLYRTQQRRQSYQRSRKASNRFGRGLRSALSPIKILEGKAERYRADKCQTIARRLALWIRDQGYTHVYVSNFSGVRDGLEEYLQGGYSVWKRIQNWPFYQMQGRLQSCLEEYGISFEEREAPGSTTCPKCSHDSDDNMRLDKRKFECVECGHKEHLDVARARLLLLTGSESPSDAEVDSAKPQEKSRRRTRAAVASRKARGKGAKSQRSNGAGSNGSESS